jgi:hypothetical protein
VISVRRGRRWSRETVRRISARKNGKPAMMYRKRPTGLSAVWLSAERERDEDAGDHAKRMTTSPNRYRHLRCLPHRAAST